MEIAKPAQDKNRKESSEGSEETKEFLNVTVSARNPVERVMILSQKE